MMPKALVVLLVVISSFHFTSASPMGQDYLGPIWEYLILSYTQYDTDFDGNLVELVIPSRPEYTHLAMPSCLEEDCLEDIFQGLDYYLDVFGLDGWELVTLIDKSTQYSYRVELIFKRQRRGDGITSPVFVVTPIATPRPTPIPRPSDMPQPVASGVVVVSRVALSSEPMFRASVITDLTMSEHIAVLGQGQDGAYLCVATNTGVVGWISRIAIRLESLALPTLASDECR